MGAGRPAAPPHPFQTALTPPGLETLVRSKLPLRHIAVQLLAARSPPRLRRWRVVLPDEAGTGLTPHSAAKLASDCRRAALSPAVRSSCAADPCPSSSGR